MVDENGDKVRDAAIETGFLRPKADASLEWLLTHNTGFAEVSYGTAETVVSASTRLSPRPATVSGSSNA